MNDNSDFHKFLGLSGLVCVSLAVLFLVLGYTGVVHLYAAVVIAVVLAIYALGHVWLRRKLRNTDKDSERTDDTNER